MIKSVRGGGWGQRPASDGASQRCKEASPANTPNQLDTHPGLVRLLDHPAAVRDGHVDGRVERVDHRPELGVDPLLLVGERGLLCLAGGVAARMRRRERA
jgi:hypothetical protein